MKEKDEIRLTGVAEILQKAMHVTKFNEMIDCLKQLKHHCKTIETDLVNVDFRPKTRLHHHRITFDENLTVESVSKRRFILLHDLIEETKRSQPNRTQKPHRVSSLEGHIDSLIAAQDSALDALYLEVLLKSNSYLFYNHCQTHQRFINHNQRLKEILKKQ